jgi:cytochrome P450/NADPH-cytochrome P450 reductase
MLPAMTDIASQMLLKWDRLGPDNEIICSDDFTR